jgi:hypothetical protein
MKGSRMSTTPRSRAGRTAFAVLAFASFAGALGWSVSCSPPSDGRISIVAPSEALFPPVADLMAYRCGSLDCHGSIARNFIIWSCDGLRLDQDAAPGCRNQGGTNTSNDEYDATYRSLVGLEPLVMSQVVASGGADPELLTFIRKARGEEDHKGGTLWKPGSLDDQCATQWLAGASATTATCKAALGLDLDAGVL